MARPLLEFQTERCPSTPGWEAGLSLHLASWAVWRPRSSHRQRPHPPWGLSSLPPLPLLPSALPARTGEGQHGRNSQQLWTPMESVAQLYQRFSKMVLVVMTFPCTVDTAPAAVRQGHPSISSPTAVRKKPKISIATGMVGHRREPRAPERGRGWAGEPEGGFGQGGWFRQARERGEAGCSLGLFRGPGPSRCVSCPLPGLFASPQVRQRNEPARTAAVDEEMEGINETGQKSTPGLWAAWAPAPRGWGRGLTGE